MGSYGTLKDFGQEGEVEDGSEVCKIISVKTRFLQKVGDGSWFERLWDRSRGEGGVNNLCDEGGDGWETAFYESGRNEVQGAGRSFDV